MRNWFRIIVLVCVGNIQGGWAQTSQGMSRNMREENVSSIHQVIGSTAECHKGMFNVYVQNGHYYVEIPEVLLGRDVALVQVLTKGAAQNVRASTQLLGYAGDQLSMRIIRFVKGDDNQIWIEAPETSERLCDSLSEIARLKKVVQRKVFSMSFDIKARGERSFLIDLTNALLSDNMLFSLKDAKQTLGLGGYQADRASIVGCDAFSDNVIFRMIKCYGAGAAPDMSLFGSNAVKVEQNPTVWELAVSLRLLPEEKMRPRYEDSRVGYFVVKGTEYGADSRPLNVTYACRWRLEPKEEDIEKYMRGELVEPRKPIVFYVDYDIPEFMVPHIIAGVEDWQKAFERAGFKNAIIAKRMPRPENTKLRMDDGRLSVISYKVSPIGNAFGLQQSDPRTGEILNARISVFHCVQELLQKWYFAQVGALDEQAHHFPFSEEIMGRLVRYLVSHEVGHTLGLRHNFYASTTYTVEQLRDKNYVKKNGHTASIMDYSRFNYVAQPGDGITTDDLCPRLGEYDLFAVEWGYRYFPEMKDEHEEKRYLEEWATKQREENERRVFGTEFDVNNPRLQSGDLTDNSIAANEFGMKNLKLLSEHLEKWTAGDDVFASTQAEMYKGMCDQYLAYIEQVVSYVGGHQNRLDGTEYPVSKEKQKEALAFLDKHFFHAPDWLFEERLVAVAKMNKVRVMRMLYGRECERLVKACLYMGRRTDDAESRYLLADYLADLYGMLFSELQTGEAVNVCRRQLQRMYVKNVRKVLAWEFLDYPEIAALLAGHLEKICKEAKNAAEKSEDYMTKIYWEDMVKNSKL